MSAEQMGHDLDAALARAAQRDEEDRRARMLPAPLPMQPQWDWIQADLAAWWAAHHV